MTRSKENRVRCSLEGLSCYHLEPAHLGTVAGGSIRQIALIPAQKWAQAHDHNSRHMGTIVGTWAHSHNRRQTSTRRTAHDHKSKARLLELCVTRVTGRNTG